MKKFLPWFKANLVSVISVVVALLAAPVMLYFALDWAGKVRQGVERDVADNLQQLNASDVTYSVDPYLSGQEPVTVKSPPNEATTSAIARLLQAVVSGTDAVRERAVDFNRSDKQLLVEGLFPENKDDSTRLRLLDQLIQRWPAAHEQLLTEFRAGLPPDPVRIRATLEDLRNKEVARITTGGTEANLTAEQLDQLTNLLGRTRLDAYRRAASDLAFYATPAVFKSVQPWDRSKVLPMESAWEWQHQYWIHRDIIKALSSANSDSLGSRRPVHLAPVKILESITLSRPGDRPGASDRALTTPTDLPPAGPPDGRSEVQRNYTLSHTGHAAAPAVANPLYDIRYADIVLVVASSKLPELLAAFPRVNFMTVVDADLEDYDSMTAISQGYDLGSDHVVKATLRVETIWLRSWMRQWMPPTVRKSLGIPEEQPASTETPAESAVPQG
jgi:hypothetical protein